MSHRALIAEPSAPVSAALRNFLEGGGFEAKAVHTVEEAAAQAAHADLLFASSVPGFDGEALCARVKRGGGTCAVVLVYPPDEDNPDARAVAAMADAYLVGPLKRGTVVSVAKAMLRIRELLQTVERLESDLKKHVADTLPQGKAGSAADFAFFKKFLLMEVKRSRRYRYPVSFLLIAVDHFGQRMASRGQGERTAALAEALRLLSGGLRDIDLAVPAGADRFLVFLPHTAREGALTVASRLKDRVAKMKSLEEATASVGVASFEPADTQGQVSFGSLMKDASEALQRAQQAGGDRVEAGERGKRGRISMG